MYWPTIPINMINARNIKKDTKVRPEKKPSAINETKIKTKEENLKFTPTYFWFDIDNIEIQYEVK